MLSHRDPYPDQTRNSANSGSEAWRTSKPEGRRICAPGAEGLIEQKIGALDQAAPLEDWDLPEAFATLRRLIEARMGKAGKREYVQVLRLLETFRLAEVEATIYDALKLGAIGFDAVKHLVLCRIERRPPRLDLDLYPYLPKARVAATSARSYMSLLSRTGT